MGRIRRDKRRVKRGPPETKPRPPVPVLDNETRQAISEVHLKYKSLHERLDYLEASPEKKKAMQSATHQAKMRALKAMYDPEP